MSGTATIAITVGVAVAVLVGFFIVYYLGNVANSIYDIKVGVRKDFDKKVKEMQEFVDKETKQRLGWMRDENREELKRHKISLEDHQEETIKEMEKTIERLRADLTSLQMQVMNMADGKKVKFNEAPPARKPAVADKDKPLGDLDVARVGMPDSEAAPDTAAPIAKKEEGNLDAALDKAEGVNPAADKPALAGKASVERKARRKKKRKNPDEFEAFGAFSNDFKAGS